MKQIRTRTYPDSNHCNPYHVLTKKQTIPNIRIQADEGAKKQKKTTQVTSIHSQLCGYFVLIYIHAHVYIYI